MDLPSEAAILAIVMFSGSTEKVRSLLRPEHFGNDANKIIFNTYLELEAAGIPIDDITLANSLRGQGLLERVGGSSYLAQISEGPFQIANATAYAQIVVDKCRVRQLLKVLEKITTEGYSVNGQSSEYVQAAMEAVINVAKRDIIVNWNTIDQEIDNMVTPTVRIPTGIDSLDEALRGGIPTGRILTIVGAPGSSKTTIAFQIVMNMRDRGDCLVYVCAYDEEPRDLLTRLGRHRGLSRDAIEQAEPGIIEQLRVIAKENDWMVLDGMLDGALNLRTAIEVLIAKAAAAGKIPVLMLDSIQRAWVPGIEDCESMKQRVDMIIEVLKWARGKGVVIVATCEANRSLYKDKGKLGEVNLLAVAKESGAVEYQSSAMLVLKKFESDDEETDGMIVGQFPKNRIGLDDRRELWFVLDRERSLLVTADPPVSDKGGPNARGPAKGPDRTNLCAVKVEDYIRKYPGVGTKLIRENVTGFSKDTIDAAILWLKRENRILIKLEGRTQAHYVT